MTGKTTVPHNSDFDNHHEYQKTATSESLIDIMRKVTEDARDEIVEAYKRQLTHAFQNKKKA